MNFLEIYLLGLKVATYGKKEETLRIIKNVEHDINILNSRRADGQAATEV